MASCYYSSCDHAKAVGYCAQCGVPICENHAKVYKVHEFLPPELGCVDLDDDPLHVMDEIESWVLESTETELEEESCNASVTMEPYEAKWWNSRT